MRKIDFNANWTCKEAVTSMVESLTGGGSAKKLYEWSGTLPHDAMIDTVRDPKNPTGSPYGHFAGSDYDYTKTFSLPAEEAGNTYVLEFEGIFNHGRVYVNDVQVGAVHYGYTGIKMDITPYLNFGGDNTVLVKVIASDLPSSRWYTGAGLYRPAWLHVGGPVRIAVDGLRVKTLAAQEKNAVVEIELQPEHDRKAAETVLVHTVLKAADGTVAGENTTPYTFDEECTPLRQKVLVREAKLWSAETPNLYSCEVELVQNGQVLDSKTVMTGIRTLAVNPAEGFLVNGTPVKFRGACIHHDNGPVGAATFARAEERRVEKLKEAGFNAIRVSHNSTSKALLDAADRVGMYIMEESFDIWTKSKSRYDYSLYFLDNWEKDVTDIVNKDFNHPSVVMYSIGNEIQDLNAASGRLVNRKLINKFHELDATRPVTNAINTLMGVMANSQVMAKIMLDLGLVTMEQLQAMAAGGGAGGDINDVMTNLLGHMNDLANHPLVHEAYAEVFGAMDLVGVNYARGTYDSYPEVFPNMVYYGSETLPPDIDLNWEKVMAHPGCVGDFDWTGWDYIGESGVGLCEYDKPAVFSKGYPAYLAYCGDIDITGFRRPESYRKEVIWGLRKAPYIAVQLPEHYGQKCATTPWVTPETVSSWTWKGFEGKHCIVEVYSDAPEVELFINGKSAGTQPAGKGNRFTAKFDVAYEAGTVEAAAKYADGSVEKTCLKTAADAVELAVAADKAKVAVDDLVYIDVQLKDAAGVLNADADRKVSVSVEGAALVQGFGSGDPVSEENFFDAERTTYRGHLVAVIRAKSAGTVKVTFTAEGCAPAAVEFTAE